MATEGHRVRPVQAIHVSELIRIGQETNLSAWSAESYLDEIKHPNAIMLRIVTEANQTVGFVVGRTVLGGETEARLDAEIYNIGVSSQNQRCGYGQILLEAFVDEALSRGVRNIWLEVRETNVKAINFYRKNGFKQMQTRPNFYDDPREAALLMRLELPQE